MSGWGIGLGGFTQGLDNGIRNGVSIANFMSQKKDRELRENHLAVQEANQAQELDLRKKAEARAQQQFDEAEHDRQRSQADEDQRRGVFTQGNDAYNAAVKAGTAKPNDAYDWFAHVYAPHVEQFYLQKGDVQNAATFHKWSQDENTAQQIRDMGKLVGTYHDAATTGDFGPLKRGLTKFYNDLPADVTGGRKFTDLSVGRDTNGNVTAVNATFTTPDGKTVTQNLGDLGQFQQYLQGVMNPAALYEHTMASETQANKFKADIAEYAAKKNIDIGEDKQKRALGLTGKTPQERYADAQAALTKNSIDGKPPTDAQARAYLAQQDAFAASNAPGLGGGAAPPAPVIVDTKTGRAMNAPGQPSAAPQPQPAPNPSAVTAPRPGSSPDAPAATPQPQQGAPPPAQASPTGLGGAPAPAAPAAAPGRVVMPQAGPTPGPQYPSTSDVDVGDYLQKGARAIGSALKGGPPAPLNIDQINAARKASGQPPLTPDQAAQILNKAGGQQQQADASATPPGAPQQPPAPDAPGGYGLPM
jgi:hypothetical protein